jgi:DNA-directed RNA polymerase subunit omega
MARVTIEDCLEKVDDRFELVALAAQRAKEISSGSNLTIDRKGEKDTVISLREIAEGTIKISDLRKGIVSSFQKNKDRLEQFIAPISNNSDSIDIDQEEADIRAAIAEAQEIGLENEDDESLESLSETSEEQEIDEFSEEEKE